jgi:hypothetical protein
MSSLRIVLVDPLGDVLFSGESLARSGTVAMLPTNEWLDTSEVPTERCPETLRSEGSGVYPAADHGAFADSSLFDDDDGAIRAETRVRAKALKRTG